MKNLGQIIEVLAIFVNGAKWMKSGSGNPNACQFSDFGLELRPRWSSVTLMSKVYEDPRINNDCHDPPTL